MSAVCCHQTLDPRVANNRGCLDVRASLTFLFCFAWDDATVPVPTTFTFNCTLIAAQRKTFAYHSQVRLTNVSHSEQIQQHSGPSTLNNPLWSVKTNIFAPLLMLTIKKKLYPLHKFSLMTKNKCLRRYLEKIEAKYLVRRTSRSKHAWSFLCSCKLLLLQWLLMLSRTFYPVWCHANCRKTECVACRNTATYCIWWSLIIIGLLIGQKTWKSIKMTL